MAGMVRKLIVEVVEARNLLPKDGTGTSSPYVIVDFDGQRKRTLSARRDLNPRWNEVLEFNVNGAGTREMAGEVLEIDVLHDRKVGPSRRNNFLGRLRLDSSRFVRKGEEALMHFPLEKKSFFSWIRGDIGLKIYFVDEPDAPPPPPPDAEKPEEISIAADAPADSTTNSEKSDAPAVAPPPEQPADVTEKSATPPPETVAETEAPLPPDENAVDAENPSESEIPPPDNNEAGAHEPLESNLPPAEEPVTEEPTLSPPQPEDEPTPASVIQPEARPIHRSIPPPPERGPDAIERSTYDLVDKMQYLFVRVVRARRLPGDAKPHVRVAASGRHVSTRTARRSSFFEWNQTFAFPRNPTAADSTLEVSVWDLPPESDVTYAGEKNFLGGVCFDVSEVPTRDPPDSPLATQWFRLEGGGAYGGDLMLATWIGTQADESFSDAWKVDASSSHVSSRSKVYLSPKLCYLRATILEAQDVLTPLRESAVYIKATLGFQVLRSRTAVNRNCAPSWNEDLIFVAAEPFGEDQRLVFSLENRHGKEIAVLGSTGIPLSSVERRVDDRKVASRWLDLVGEEIKKKKKNGHSGRLHVRVCLDGGYHVTDEPVHVSSDFRPSARQLWRAPIGTVELGIIGCRSLLPMRTVDGKGSTDTYAVAKYGPKWARTRTIADSFDPTWNEQYTWQVYDPCTVLTIGVFDESEGCKDSTCRPIGKVRIRISTLESNRVYRSAYPLLLLLPSGVKKMGEIELAVRFARAGSSIELLHVYGQPMLPAMHHVRPIPAGQREALRLAAARIVAGHLSRSEPSMRREVVMWMLEAEPRGFSMRRVRANWYRIVCSLSWVTDVARWMDDTRAWRNPTATALAHGVLVLLVWYPDLILPTLALHVFGVGAWKYRYRPRVPAAHPCVKTSQVESVDRDELDEEFDPVPSSRGAEVVRARYDRVRTVGARVQTMLGDVAAQAERVQALVTWRDPRATRMFIGLCFLVSVVLYVVPSKIVAVASGFYFLRHPMFRDRMPPPALNYFRRLPALSDRIM